MLIARALAAEPSLLVLDEPESNLDFKKQKRVLSTISTLCKERGIAAVINTHYPEHAMDISQRALLLMPDKSAIFGGTANVLTEENLRRAFEISVHIHRFKVGRRDYTSILPPVSYTHLDVYKRQCFTTLRRWLAARKTRWSSRICLVCLIRFPQRMRCATPDG